MGDFSLFVDVDVRGIDSALEEHRSIGTTEFIDDMTITVTMTNSNRQIKGEKFDLQINDTDDINRKSL